MEDIRITPTILALKRTPAEKILLAYICQRAVASDGTCTDTNKELGEATVMHPQTVSDLVNRLGQTQWLKITEQNGTIQRIVTPHSDLVVGYKLIAYPSPKPITYLPNKASTSSLSQSLTPYPPITDSRLWAAGKVARVGERLCPITGVDIGRQRNDTHYVNSKTLKHLASRQPHIFLSLAKQLCPDETPNMEWPGETCSRMARIVQTLAASGQPFKSIVLPNRVCPITSIDVNHQSTSYALVTASTLQLMFKGDREQFDKVAAKFLTPQELNESMSSQLSMLNHRIKSKAKELGPLLELLTQSDSNTPRFASIKQAPEEDRPVRYCPITGIDITHQRPNCHFATRMTLSRLFRQDQSRVEELIFEFLPAKYRNEPLGYQVYHLSDAVRQAGEKASS